MLDALGIQRAIFVGHSFGGGPTLEAALRRPDRVEALVLADPAVNFDEAPDGGGAVAARAVDPAAPQCDHFGDGHESEPDALFDVAIRGAGRGGESRASDRSPATARRAGINQRARRLARQRFSHPKRAFSTQSPAAYAAFNRPTLIIWGALDTTTPLEQGKRLDRADPGLAAGGHGRHRPHASDRRSRRLRSPSSSLHRTLQAMTLPRAL